MTPTSRAARYQGTRDEQVWKCARRLSRNIRTAALDVEDLYQVGQVAILEGKGDFVYQAMIDELKYMQWRRDNLAKSTAHFLSVERVREISQQRKVEGRAWSENRVLEIELAMGSVMQPDFIVALDQALAKMPPLRREIVRQQSQGRSAREIGKSMGLSENQVDQQSFQLKHKLLQEVI